MDDERFTEPYQDPGWSVIYQRPIESPGVLAVRMLFLSLLATPFVLLFVLFNIFSEVGEVSLPLTILTLFLGLAGVGAASMTMRRKLSLDSAKALGTSYRNRFFVGFILNEVPLLVAFALCFVEDAIWPYLMDFPLYLVGMALVAPSPRNFIRVQQQILTSGSSLQLGRSLDAITESR
jgi:hypothetical protein